MELHLHAARFVPYRATLNLCECVDAAVCRVPRINHDFRALKRDCFLLASSSSAWDLEVRVRAAESGLVRSFSLNFRFSTFNRETCIPMVTRLTAAGSCVST